MKRQHFSTLLVTSFSLLLALYSHAFRLETTTLTDLNSVSDVKTNDRHGSSSESAKSKIVLPIEQFDETDVIESSAKTEEASDESKKFKIGLPMTEVDLDHFVNRHPVHLSNRLPYPALRFFPHRCGHHLQQQHQQQQKQQRFFPHPDHRFGELDQNVIGLMYKKNRGGAREEAFQHRHVARKFPGGEVATDEGMKPRMFIKPPHYLIPRQHPRHHHRRHHDDRSEDPTVVIKRENEEEIEHHHHNEHHDDEERHEVRENAVMRKVRKFLAYF